MNWKEIQLDWNDCKNELETNMLAVWSLRQKPQMKKINTTNRNDFQSLRFNSLNLKEIPYIKFQIISIYLIKN